MDEEYEGQVCSRCGNPALTLQDGMLICEACGTQAEDFIEETAEFQVGIDDAARRRRMRMGTRDQTIVAGEVEDVPAQAEALVTEFGAQRSTADLALPLWTAVLAQSGVLNDEQHEHIEAQVQGRGVGEEAESRHNKRPFKNELRDALTVLLPPHTLLVICLLACWLGREAVCHTDLIRGALLGQLPFLDMPARCRSLMESPAGAVLPVHLMKSSTQIAGLLSAQKLLNKAAETAADLELQLPPLNAALVLQRSILELGMPQALLPASLALYRCYREGTNYMRLYELQNRSPYLYLIAVLIVAIKIWYRLDGAPTAAGNGMPASPNWVTWAQSALDRLQGPFYPPNTQQVTNMSNPQLAKYKQHLQQYVFAGWAPPDDLKEWVRMFERVLRNANLGEEKPEDDAGLETSQAGVEGAPVLPSQAPSAQPIGIHAYYLTAETRRLTRDKVTPEYAALLTACSTYLWVTPHLLHAEVAQLEYEMAEVEAVAAASATEQKGNASV